MTTRHPYPARPANRRRSMAIAGLMVGFLAILATASRADGVFRERSASRLSAAKLREFYESRNAALARSIAEADDAVEKVRYRYATQVALARPVKDKYGDPMYTRYGHRAYAGTPYYNGPAYVASFETEFVALPPGSGPAPHRYEDQGGNRDYWRQAYSNPRYAPTSDTSLGVGASHSFMQHGMLSDPGAVGVSASRAIEFNKR